jgi:uncharacterized protein
VARDRAPIGQKPRSDIAAQPEVKWHRTGLPRSHDAVMQQCMSHLLLLAGAGFLAGAMNAAAGGGSFVSFPAMIFAGVPPVHANASSTVALFPGAVTSGWAYRNALGGIGEVSLPMLLAVSVLGGLLGAVLLLATPSRAFDVLVPWLLLLATLAFAFGRQAGLALRRVLRLGRITTLTAQFALAIYGGYFGGAVGIMMMAVWSLLGTSDLRQMNPTKTVLVGAMNGMAVLYFIAAGAVVWPQTLAMLFAAALGGYAGAHLAMRLDTRWLRAGVIAISSAVTLSFFLRGT